MSAERQEQWTKRDLIEVAKGQKNVLWMVLLGVAAVLLARQFPYVSLVTGLVQAYFVYKLAVSVGSSAAWVYVILMFIPLVGLLALLHINAKATGILKSNGIKVGLMGARMTDLESIPED